MLEKPKRGRPPKAGESDTPSEMLRYEIFLLEKLIWLTARGPMEFEPYREKELREKFDG